MQDYRNFYPIIDPEEEMIRILAGEQPKLVTQVKQPTRLISESFEPVNLSPWNPQDCL